MNEKSTIMYLVCHLSAKGYNESCNAWSFFFINLNFFISCLQHSVNAEAQCRSALHEQRVIISWNSVIPRCVTSRSSCARPAPRPVLPRFSLPDVGALARCIVPGASRRVASPRDASSRLLLRPRRNSATSQGAAPRRTALRCDRVDTAQRRKAQRCVARRCAASLMGSHQTITTLCSLFISFTARGRLPV